MKKLLLSLSILLSVFAIKAQTTATNFTANDCAGASHDLFTELNSGKIIVITWVMPCSACTNGAKFAQNAVNSFSASNPGTVLHYVADDYANTSCATLLNWLNTNSVTPNARFSNSSVNMTGYGTAGMPKVVVLGGTSHTIYYNVNNASITQANITTAINTALAANATGIHAVSAGISSVRISPNPVSNELTLTVNSGANGDAVIEIYNVTGQNVKSFEKSLNAGTNELKMNVEELSSGTYFLKLSNGKASESLKFIINK
jgi:hypothetical protein